MPQSLRPTPSTELLNLCLPHPAIASTISILNRAVVRFSAIEKAAHTTIPKLYHSSAWPQACGPS